jgi:hypothetical protein
VRERGPKAHAGDEKTDQDEPLSHPRRQARM